MPTRAKPSITPLFRLLLGSQRLLYTVWHLLRGLFSLRFHLNTQQTIWRLLAGAAEAVKWAVVVALEDCFLGQAYWL